MFEFDIQHQQGKARTATLSTPHGTVSTPMFMPVGTLGSVKSLSPKEIAATGSQIILGNTYHLLLRPGAEVVADLGGLHGFAQYHGPWLTDSGGFQVMSLAKMRKIDEQGVTFQNHLNGAQTFISPEVSVRTQELLGADIIMAFDECPPYPCSEDYLKTSIDRTLRWLHRCFDAKTRNDQALFPIAQGGVSLQYREYSTSRTIAFDAPGYAIGGLAVGEPKEGMYPAIQLSTDILPNHKPRYLMGVGHPEDLVAAVGLGVDMFDCVYPTRTGRFGNALVDQGRLNLRNATHKQDPNPIDPQCNCEACTTFSRAYISHLIRCDEMLGMRLISLHNVRYLHRLIERCREAIVQQRYGRFALEYANTRWPDQPMPAWFRQALEDGGHL